MRISLITLLTAILLAGCVKIEIDSSPPSMILGIGKSHQPQFKIDGKGMFVATEVNGTFHVQMRGALDEAWIKCVGTVTISRENEVVIALHSSADRQYDIQLIGLSKHDASASPTDDLKQTIHVSKGEQDVKVVRYLVQTCDFSKT